MNQVNELIHNSKKEQTFYERMNYIDWVFKVDITESADNTVVVIYALIIMVLMIICRNLFEGSRSKVVEISSPLRHILKDNQTYSLTSILMMRLI